MADLAAPAAEAPADRDLAADGDRVAPADLADGDPGSAGIGPLLRLPCVTGRLSDRRFIITGLTPATGAAAAAAAV